MELGIDSVVLLAPVLVLAVVALLGFAGCHLVFGSDPPPPPFLTLRARVPTALVVREIVFSWDPPNTPSGQKPLVKPDPTGFDGDDNLFDHVLSGELDFGSWSVRCQVIVAGGTQQGDEDMGMFSLPVDGSTNPIATFQATATGGPTTLDIAFIGAA